MKRHERYIYLRYPFFSAVSHCGLFFGVAILDFSMLFSPRMNCGVMVLAAYTLSPLYFFPVVLKAVGYGVLFYIHEGKARSRFELVATNQEVIAKENAFYLWRFVHYLSFRYLLAAFGVALCATTLLSIGETAAYYRYYSHNMLDCNYAFMQYRFAALMTVNVLVVFAVAVLIRKSKDAFNIKREFSIIIFIATLTMILYFVYLYLNMPDKIGLRVGIILVVGQIVVFCVNTIWPCLHVIREQATMPSYDQNSVKEFAAALENLHFRNCFYEFLKLQFCSESLLCWEAIYDWHQNESYTTDQAQYIFDKFIGDDAPFLLNTTLEEKSEIEGKIKSGKEIEANIFDTIAEVIEHELYVGSYRQFLRSPTATPLSGVINPLKSINLGH